MHDQPYIPVKATSKFQIVIYLIVNDFCANFVFSFLFLASFLQFFLKKSIAFFQNLFSFLMNFFIVTVHYTAMPLIKLRKRCGFFVGFVFPLYNQGMRQQKIRLEKLGGNLEKSLSFEKFQLFACLDFRKNLQESKVRSM